MVCSICGVPVSGLVRENIGRGQAFLDGLQLQGVAEATDGPNNRL